MAKTESYKDYQSFEPSRFYGTIGGGMARLNIGSAGNNMQMVCGSAHVDVNDSYASIVFGSNYIRIDSSGIHTNPSI